MLGCAGGFHAFVACIHGRCFVLGGGRHTHNLSCETLEDSVRNLIEARGLDAGGWGFGDEHYSGPGFRCKGVFWVLDTSIANDWVGQGLSVWV
jgi:hypothetical protein